MTPLLKAFKYRLYPTEKEKQAINETIETCRRLYNRELELKITKYKEEKQPIGRKELQLYVKAQRLENTYMKAVYVQVLHEVGIRMMEAYNNFFRRVKSGKEKQGFPKFKGRQHYNSFCYTQGGFKVTNDILHLSMIGDIKINLHRPIEGKIKTCTITWKSGKYFVCFSCEVEPNILPSTGKQIGIDVGLIDSVITSDGDFYPKIEVYRKSEKKLKYLQRMVSRRKKGSNRRKKAVALLAKLHEKIANQRRDIIHNTAKEIIKNYDLIAHEDLNIKGMVKNHHLAKSINDAGWFKLFECLEAKANDAGRKVIKVPPEYTSQICSSCGTLVKKDLWQRVHKCECGLIMHRDVNAAKNILAIALSSLGDNTKPA